MEDLDKEKINKLIQEASKSRKNWKREFDWFDIIRFEIF
jgi:hypothetical protein